MLDGKKELTMIGVPKYQKDDSVKFTLVVDGKNCELEGKVCVVDAYGTFFQQDEPSYDIMVGNTLYKHIRESSLELA